MKLGKIKRWQIAVALGIGSVFGCSSSSEGTVADAGEEGVTGDAPSDAGPGHADAGDGNGDGTDGGSAAPHADFPRIESAGGPVLRIPNVVPIFFANDPLQAQVEQFLGELAVSSFWTETTSEYGVQGLRVGPSVVVPDPIPRSISDIETERWMADHLNGTHPEWPAIDGSNVYVLLYPPGTTITIENQASCVNFGGYHTEGSLQPGTSTDDASTDAAASADAVTTDAVTTDAASTDAASADAASADAATVEGGTPESGATVTSDAGTSGPSFVYAVLPRCARADTLVGLDSLTAALTHELIESATNPFIRTRGALQFVDSDHAAWAIGLNNSLLFGEVADMCHSQSQDRLYQRLVGQFMVHRSWSNVAASSNRDPCVPAIPTPYFGAAPDLDEPVMISDGAGSPNTVLTRGLKVGLNQSKVVNVRLFSTGPVSDWFVTPFQSVAAAGQANLRLTLDRNRGNNGDILKLTVTRIANGPTFGGTEIALASSAMPPPPTGLPPASTLWYGYVQN